MADNITALANTGSGTDVLATDEIAGVHVPLVKLMLGDLDTDAGPVSEFNPLPTYSDATIVGFGPSVTEFPIANGPSGLLGTYLAPETHDYAPGYGVDTGTTRELVIDPERRLQIRGSVLTDEGTFRANFANSSYELSIGSATSGGSFFSGLSGLSTSDIHIGDYVKISGDADTAWLPVSQMASSIVFVDGTYSGASGSGTLVRSIMKPVIGTGGSLSVGSGQLTIAGGTTATSVTGMLRAVDYAPLVFRSRFSISQRIANQTLYAGLQEDASTIRFFARFSFSGTTNTAVVCETGRNPSGAPSASETEQTTVTLPNGLTTATAAEYRVELLTEMVRFYVNDVLVATHSRVVPMQYDEMAATVRIVNGTTPATNTNVVVDYVTCKNHNRIETGIMSDGEKIIAAASPLVPYSYSQAGVIAINTDLIVIDCLQLKALSIQCQSMGTTGVVTVQWSNDAAFTAPITATLMSETGATSTTITAASLRYTHVIARYCRLRLTTATTAGTTTFIVQGSQSILGPASQQVQGSVTVSGSLTSGGTVTNTPATPTQSFINSAATTNATSVKASAGTVYGITATNINAAIRYLKLYNKASAPTVGTDVPVLSIPIPATGQVSINPGAMGIRFGTGIALAITAAAADTDTTAVAASEIKVATSYI